MSFGDTVKPWYFLRKIGDLFLYIIHVKSYSEVGDDRGKSGFVVNHGAVNQGFTVLKHNETISSNKDWE